MIAYNIHILELPCLGLGCPITFMKHALLSNRASSVDFPEETSKTHIKVVTKLGEAL